MTDTATILDMCCGSRMFWFDKQDERAVFSDIRAEEHKLCDGRHLIINPDLIADFRALPFADSSFPVVVFDPPHLERVGDNAWMGKKYGTLNKDTWRDDLRDGFREAFRVLRPHGVLVFKWNETQIPVSQVIALTDVKPVIWQRTGKADKTHWIIFVKRSAGTVVQPVRGILACDMCGHDAFLQENGWYECDEGHSFVVRRDAAPGKEG